MELGISARAGIEADLRTRPANAVQRTVTEHILTVADQAGYRAALIDAAAGPSVITWPQFAHMVRTAARGLSRRGLREADTAGILVHDAVSHVVAVHAVRAAGAIAVPIRPSQTATDIAAQLKQGRVRLLITSAALAELAIQAAERSWVRQVFAFGEAEGTTPFDSLLHTARHGQPQVNASTGHDGDTSHNGSPRHNGSTRHDGYDDSNGHSGSQAPHVADLTGLGPDSLGPDGLGPDSLGPDSLGPDSLGGPDGLGLTDRDVVVAAPPCGDPDAYTSLLDLALAAGATIVAAPLPQITATVGVYKGTVAIVPREMDVPGLPAERVFTVA